MPSFLERSGGRRIAIAFTVGAVALVSIAALAEANHVPPPNARQVRAAPGDSADIAAVIERYHGALASGDSATALSLLTDDAVILESGGIETRAEYRSHHLPADIAFARAVKNERSAVRVVVRGDVGWASSTSVTQGEYRGRPINSAGAELMVLVRDPAGWKVSAIHWSSRNRRP